MLQTRKLMSLSSLVAGTLFTGTLLCSCVSGLSGTLQDPTGAPIAAAPLNGQVNATRLDESGKGLKSHVTPLNPDGTFAFESLEEGLYLIEAIVPGYEIASKKQNISTGDEITLTLSPIDAVDAKSIRYRSSIDADKGAGSATLTPPHL